MKKGQDYFEVLKIRVKKAITYYGSMTVKNRDLFPMATVEMLGINNFEQLEYEFNAIDSKKSKRSSMERKAIQKVYLHIWLLLNDEAGD